jgi:hypothetical protein
MRLQYVLLAVTWGVACRGSLSPPTNHRPNDSPCSASPIGPGTCNCATCSGSEFACTADAACNDGANGRCIGSLGGPAGCSCTYDACSSDSMCPAGDTCACYGTPYMPQVGNSCVSGNCRVDADCGHGGYCSPSPGAAGFLVGYYCHTQADSCRNDTDCVGFCGAAPGASLCAYSTSAQRWQCQCFPIPV